MNATVSLRFAAPAAVPGVVYYYPKAVEIG